MKLYYFPGACSLADHIVLEWTGIEHEAVRMSRDTIKTEAYLALNPNGTVPLLVDGDFALTENAAILGYIAEQRPEATLLGDGTPRGRAEVMRWLAYLNSDVHMAFKPLFTPSRFLPDEAMAEVLAEQARLQIAIHLKRLDEQLEGKDWLIGQPVRRAALGDWKRHSLARIQEPVQIFRADVQRLGRSCSDRKRRGCDRARAGRQQRSRVTPDLIRSARGFNGDNA